MLSEIRLEKFGTEFERISAHWPGVPTWTAESRPGPPIQRRHGSGGTKISKYHIYYLLIIYKLQFFSYLRSPIFKKTTVSLMMFIITTGTALFYFNFPDLTIISQVTKPKGYWIPRVRMLHKRLYWRMLLGMYTVII